jgi:hypothetical protein
MICPAQISRFPSPYSLRFLAKEGNVRIFLYVALFCILLAAIAGSATTVEQYAIPISNGTSVFSHNPRIIAEPPAFTAGIADRLLIIEKQDGKFKVTNRNHLVGWIDPSVA